MASQKGNWGYFTSINGSHGPIWAPISTYSWCSGGHLVVKIYRFFLAEAESHESCGWVGLLLLARNNPPWSHRRETPNRRWWWYLNGTVFSSTAYGEKSAHLPQWTTKCLKPAPELQFSLKHSSYTYLIPPLTSTQVSSSIFYCLVEWPHFQCHAVSFRGVWVLMAKI